MADDLQSQGSPLDQPPSQWGSPPPPPPPPRAREEPQPLAVPEPRPDARIPGVEGQAIAWDRSAKNPELWTIKRSTSQVLTFKVPHQAISDPTTPQWKVVGPGDFEQ